MFVSKGSCRFVDDETDKQAKRFDEELIGCTLFYADRQDGEEAQHIYMDTLDGVMELELPIAGSARMRGDYIRGMLEMAKYAPMLHKCFTAPAFVKRREKLADKIHHWAGRLKQAAAAGAHESEVFGGSASDAARHRASVSKAFKYDGPRIIMTHLNKTRIDLDSSSAEIDF